MFKWTTLKTPHFTKNKLLFHQDNSTVFAFIIDMAQINELDLRELIDGKKFVVERLFVIHFVGFNKGLDMDTYIIFDDTFYINSTICSQNKL